MIGHMLSYNMGRVVTYGLLGVVFGLIGQTAMLSGLQKSLSIVSGVFLIILFLMTIDIETLLSRFGWYRQSLGSYTSWFSRFIGRMKHLPTVVLGAVNGLLPCGLVYLALLGAMTSGGVWNGALFMTAFGMGTIPAMLGVVIFGRELFSIRSLRLQRLLPVMQLCLGVYLIYRGWVVDMPQELDFYSLLAQPVRCH